MATPAQPQNIDLFGNPTLSPRDLMQQTLAQIMQDTAQQTAGADPRTQGVSMMGAAAGGLLSKVLIDKGILPKPPAMVRAENLAKTRDAIQQDAAANGIDMTKDPQAFADNAVRHFMAADYPGHEEDATKALLWGQQQAAVKRAADLEAAKKANLEADTALKNRMPDKSGRGDYFVPVDTADGVKAFDSRRGVIVDPVTKQPITAPVVKSSSNPTLQANIAGAKKGAEGASTLTTSDAENALKISDQVDTAKEGLQKMLKYSANSVGGTGPFATVGGLKQYTSADLQDLAATFNKINLRNLVQTFQGFSRSIDTDVERQAWDVTQPSINNDDPVNVKILIGNIALGTKAAAEAQARQDYIAQSPNKSLEGYKSPVIGKATVMFNATGDAQMVPKEQTPAAQKQGWMNADQYAARLLKGGVRPTPQAAAPAKSPVDALLEKYAPVQSK